MFKLRTGYFISGIITGIILLVNVILSLPDGRLHLVFCDVGQGDATYIRFPDGRDMLIDGGPDDKVLNCLGSHMPFWDRRINLVVLSHPQKDHLQGLLTVFERFTVDYFITSGVGSETKEYLTMLSALKKHQVPLKIVSAGDEIKVGSTTLLVVWPAKDVGFEYENRLPEQSIIQNFTEESSLGLKKPDLNYYSVVLLGRFGKNSFLFPGDADKQVQANHDFRVLAGEHVDLLKLPHHGSGTSITEEYLKILSPKITVVSVGMKNIYGHPNSKIIELLQGIRTNVLRTDQKGTISITADGISVWSEDR